MIPRACHLSSIAALGILLPVGGASAMPSVVTPPHVAAEAVYVANGANSNVILRVDFENNLGTVINRDANQLKKLDGLLVVNEGGGRINVLVCDQGNVGNPGRLVIYKDVESPAFDGTSSVVASFPGALNAVTADVAGNLFAVGRDAGRKGKWAVSTLARTGSGEYGAPVAILTNIASDGFEDIKVVRTSAGNLQVNDLLVLSSGNPAKVFHFRKTGSTWGPVASNPFDPALAGLSPQGLAFAGGSGVVNVLISSGSGSVLRFDASGNRLSPDFVSGLGNGVFQIVVGFQGGQNRAFVTQRNGHNVYAIKINADGTGTIVDSESSGLTQPQGVGLANASGFYVPAAASVTAAFNTQSALFNRVSQAGIADVTCRLLPADPREFPDPDHPCTADKCTGSCTEAHDFCLRSLFLDELDPALKHVEIPSDMRSFPIGDPNFGPTAPRQFFFCEAKTTARFRTVSITEESKEFLGWPSQGEPVCTDETTSKRPMFYWTPIPDSDEHGIFEGSRFINLSTGCGDSNRGDIDDYSYLIPTARTDKPLPEVVNDMFAGLEGAIGQLSDSIADTQETDLLARLQEAKDAFESFVECGNTDDRDAALKALEAFRGIIDANPGAFDDSERNVSGHLLVRSNAASWIISQTPAAASCLTRVTH